MAERDEGVDIVKFFLGVMALLTVFVALIAVYNWSKVTGLAEEVEAEEIDLQQIQRVSGNPEFLELVARQAFFKDVEDVTSRDFGRFLEESAQALNVKFAAFQRLGAGGQSAARQTYDKQSYQFTIDRQRLEVIVGYLWYLQGSWPGLKIEEISLQEARAQRGQTTEGWQATVTASIFRPKEQPAGPPGPPAR